ncbi:MAG TPA: NUDIX domain-containing protein [Dehalococcoidia bacterium]
MGYDLPAMAVPDARIRFCPRCAASLEDREAFGRVRQVCPACGYVHFVDPKVVTGVLVERDGRLLLTRRNHEPKLGCWSFPSGYVDAGEPVEVAALREVEEETGVRAALDGLLGVYSSPGERVIFIVYAAHWVSGEPSPGEEAMEVGFFDPARLPALAFPHDDEIVRAWLAFRAHERRP